MSNKSGQEDFEKVQQYYKKWADLKENVFNNQYELDLLRSIPRLLNTIHELKEENEKLRKVVEAAKNVVNYLPKGSAGGASMRTTNMFVHISNFKRALKELEAGK